MRYQNGPWGSGQRVHYAIPDAAPPKREPRVLLTIGKVIETGDALLWKKP
jgi:hypothetical protein